MPPKVGPPLPWSVKRRLVIKARRAKAGVRGKMQLPATAGFHSSHGLELALRQPSSCHRGFDTLSKQREGTHLQNAGREQSEGRGRLSLPFDLRHRYEPQKKLLGSAFCGHVPLAVLSPSRSLPRGSICGGLLDCHNRRQEGERNNKG